MVKTNWQLIFPHDFAAYWCSAFRSVLTAFKSYPATKASNRVNYGSAPKSALLPEIQKGVYAATFHSRRTNLDAKLCRAVHQAPIGNIKGLVFKRIDKLTFFL
jgi:hypothetical protein